MSCFALLVAALSIWAAAPAAAAESRPYSFQRVYVPIGDMGDLQLDEMFMPMLRDRFEELVRSARATTTPRQGELHSRIAQATLTARVDGERLVNGEAHLRIEHRSEHPGILSLEPWNLVVEQAIWADPPEAEDASIGGGSAVQAGFNDAGQFTLLVPRSGDLHLSWTLRGQREGADSVAFRLQLPTSPLTRLLLEVPRGQRPVVPQALVTLDERAVDGEEWDRWLVEPSGSSPLSLRILPREPGTTSARRVLVRQHQEYWIAPLGLELTAELRLDVLHEALNQLTLHLDPRLQLVDAKLGSQTLRWTETTDEDRTLATLEMPEPLIGTDRRVRLRAVSEVRWGQLWALPQLSVAEAAWVQGRARVGIPDSLILQQLETSGGRQRAIPEAAGNSNSESESESEQASEDAQFLEIDFFGPEAEVAVLLQPRQGHLSSRTGTAINLGRSRTSAIQTIELTSTGPPRFELFLEAARDWTIDLIETHPSGLLEEWAPVGQRGRQRRFQLRLREPLSADQPLRLKVHAHGRALRGDDAWSGPRMRVARLEGATSLRRLVALTTEPPNQIRLSGDAHLVRLAANELDEADQERLGVSPGAVYYVDDAGADDLRIRLSSDPPEYAARIAVDADVGERRADLVYRFQVDPESSTLDRLNVRFCRLADGAVQWTWGDDQPLVARRQQMARLPLDDPGETWLVELPEPMDESFTLVARRSLEFSEGGLSVPLGAVPGAAVQSGMLTIRSSDSQPLHLDPHNLEPMAAEPVPPDRYGTTRGAFRYDPTQDSRLTLEPAGRASTSDLAWIWSADLVSRHDRDGRTVQQVTYRVESFGAPHLMLTLEEPGEWLAAHVEGREVALDRETSDANELRVPLPRGQRFPTVFVQYLTEQPPVGIAGRTRVVWPHVDTQIFHRTWTAWLPPGMAPFPDPDRGAGDAWYQRLFGRLLRAPDTPRFHPFLPHGWWPPAAGRNTRATLARQQAQQDLDRLWQRFLHLQDEANGAPVTWGELLHAWQPAEPEPPGRQIEVWVDQHSQELAGLTAETVVEMPELPEDPVPAAEARAAAGAALLDAADLGLVAGDQRILVTQQDSLVIEAGERIAGWPYVFARRPGSFQTSLEHATGDLRRVPLATWTAAPAQARVCWETQRLCQHILQRAGWTAHRLADSTRETGRALAPHQASAAIYQPQVFDSLGWTCWLAGFALAWWLVAGQMRRGLLLVVPAGVAALATPLLLNPIFQNLFLGTLMGSGVRGLLAWRRARARASAPALPATAMPPSATGPSATATALGSLLVLLAGLASAEEPPAVASEPPVYQVLSPVDAQDRPVGDYVFVPRAFYDVLVRDTAFPPPAAQQQWMIYDATYRASLHWNVAEEQLSVFELTAQYQLEVFTSAVTLRLPMAERQVHLLPNRVLLDGTPASVSWLDDAGGLAVEIPSPGVYRLELAFRPLVRRGDEYDSFQVAIPRVARSRLNVELSAETTGLEFPSALGRVQTDLRSGERVVQLGPADNLAVRWPSGPRGAPTPAALEVDQLNWLQVRPEQVTLETRIRLTNQHAPVTHAELVVDPRLRLLPPAEDQPISWYETLEGSTQKIQLTFQPPSQREIDLRLSFLLEDTSGIGHLFLPQVQVAADRVQREWLAISVAPPLEFDLPSAAGGGPSPAEFATAWGESESPPEVVLPGFEPGQHLVVRPRPPHAESDQRLQIGCSRDAADLTFTASIRPEHGSRAQYEVQLPPAEFTSLGDPLGPPEGRHGTPRAGETLEITAVSLQRAGDDYLASWTRPAPDRLILRTKQPLETTHVLRIEARLPVPAAYRQGALLRLPWWTLSEVPARSKRVDVYRGPQARVSPIRVSGWNERQDFQPGVYRPEIGRWEAAWQAADEAPDAVQLEIAPNRPQLQAATAIIVDREEDSWSSEVHAHLSIADGFLDTLRFEIPADWKGPFQVQPEAELSLDEIPGQGRRYLVVRPEEPMSGECRVVVRGPLSATPRDRVRVPDVVLLDVPDVDSYVVIPSRIDQQTIEWERGGLQAKPLPENFAALRRSWDVSYGTLDPRFQATIKDIQGAVGEAYVRLADYYLDVEPDGRILGVANLDLEPQGAGECRLRLPPGMHALHVRVGQLPLNLQEAPPGRLKIPLGNQRVAQRIEVLYAGQIDWNQTPWIDLPVPVVEDIPVHHACWTIRHPDNGSVRVHTAGMVTTAAKQDRLRLRTLFDLMDHAEPVLRDDDLDQLARWYLPWARRWTAVRSRLAQHGSNRDLPFLDARFREISKEWNLPDHFPNAELDGRISEPNDIWRIAGSSERRATRLIVTETAGTPRVQRSAPADRSGAARWLVATLLALLAGIALPAPSRRWLASLRRHPYGLAALVGVIWWLYFAAGHLGFLLVVASLLTALVPAVQRRRQRSDPAVTTNPPGGPDPSATPGTKSHGW